MAFDPWAQSNQALANLGQTFDSMGDRRQERERFALEQKRQEMMNRALQLKTDEMERESALQAGLRQHLQSAQGENRVMPEVPTQKPLMAGGLVNMTPQNIGGPSMGGSYNVKQQPNLERAMLQYYQQNDPAKAMEYGNQMIAKFKALADADPQGAIEWYNGVSGMNLQYAGSDEKYHYTKTDDGKVIGVNKADPRDVQVIYEGQSKTGMQSDLIDKRFENQLKLTSMTQDRQDARQNKQLAAMMAKASGQGDGLGKLDMESLKTTVRQLPKQKEMALQASNDIGRIDTMIRLIEGGVGGKRSQIAGVLAPYAEMIGVDTKSMNDSQLYNLLAKTIGGSMRAQIVGPGQVSNYEQQLLQKISGGGQAAPAAAKALLQYYRKAATDKLEDYNATIDAVSEYSPAVKKTYKKVNAPGTAQAPSQGNKGGGKQLDANTAQRFLKQAGGNKDKARELARKAGYTF